MLPELMAEPGLLNGPLHHSVIKICCVSGSAYWAIESFSDQNL